MGLFDFLITDYSSIYIDYLLLDRPIGFIPYDYDEYNNDRGFLFEYSGVTPGMRISTYKDLINFFSREDSYAVQRELVRNIFLDIKIQIIVNAC